MQTQVEMWKTLRRGITLVAILDGGYFLAVRPVERALSGTKNSIERSLQRVLGAITRTDTRIVEGRAGIIATAEIAELSLRMENGKPVARFPNPEILSVELLDFDVLSEDSGWLNKIQPADRAQILRELRNQMTRSKILRPRSGATAA